MNCLVCSTELKVADRTQRMAMFPIRTILCPVDFSDSSRSAFRVACSLGRQHGARLVVLHVNQTLGPMVAYGDVIAQLEPEEYKEKLWQVIRRLRAADSGVRVEHRLEQGDVTETILRVAQETHSDLIMMGMHGRTGFKRLLMGSVAEEIVRRAPCPVLTVKTLFGNASSLSRLLPEESGKAVPAA